MGFGHNEQEEHKTRVKNCQVNTREDNQSRIRPNNIRLP